MKYLTYLPMLAIALSGAKADQEDRGFIRQFINDTIEAVQDIDIPEIPAIGEGNLLTTLTCDAETSQECMLLDGVKGINICRSIGGVELTLCAPKVLGRFVGNKSNCFIPFWNDKCGCCGGECKNAQTAECPCKCQEGRGVLVNHNVFQVFGYQVSWKACYTPSVAVNVLNARPEFDCYTECEATDSAEAGNETNTAVAWDAADEDTAAITDTAADIGK